MNKQINAIANSKVDHNIVDRVQATRNSGVCDQEEEDFVGLNWWWLYIGFLAGVCVLLWVALYLATK